MASLVQNPALNPPKVDVKEIPIGDSSFLQKIKYDPANLQLTVTMKNGSEYVHFMVYPATVEQMLQSPSKGSFYAKNIKSKGITIRTISKNAGEKPRNLARGPIEEKKHGRQRTDH